MLPEKLGGGNKPGLVLEGIFSRLSMEIVRMNNHASCDPTDRFVKRRGFLKSVSGSALAWSIIPSQAVWSSQANSKIRLGLIGCGGRGVWITDLFKEQGGFEITAVADYFAEKSAAAGEKFSVPAERRFS